MHDRLTKRLPKTQARVHARTQASLTTIKTWDMLAFKHAIHSA